MRAIRQLPSFAAALSLARRRDRRDGRRTRAPKRRNRPRSSTTYGDIALAMYSDALDRREEPAERGRRFPRRSDATRSSPPRATRGRRRACPTCRREGFRFGNAVVDDWEGRVNSWPLDEGLIDYVDSRSLRRRRATRTRSIRRTSSPIPKIRIGPEIVDASTITPDASHQTLQGGARRGGQCRHRLPRHRIPALGAGSARHRAGRGRAAGDRLFD